jgi:hypothetical protein
MICLRTGRLASGLPIGLGFTSEASLRSVLGPGQQWTLICEQALLDMLAPLGIYHVRIDPMLVGSAAPGVPEGLAAPRREAQRSGSPRSGMRQASRRRHGKHRCHDHSLHQQSRGRMLTGCTVHRRPSSVPASAPAAAPRLE